MTQQRADKETMLELWKGPVIIWLALFALLAITVGTAYLPLGTGNLIISLMVSASKAALIVTFFMNLRGSSGLVRLASIAGLVWLSFMFALASSDYLTR